MNIKRKIVTAVASSALLLNTFATPAFAATVQITGNGAYADSSANVAVNTTTTVVQNNSANITNNVDANANSGGNDANYNNGGSVDITTGAANSTVNVTNAANANSADVACCSGAKNITVDVSNNSAFTDNNAKLNLNNDQTVTQYNDAHVTNKVDANASSGKNDANYNNGGSVDIHTGAASTNVTLNTLANVNSAKIGGGNDNNGGNLSLKIIGNSANSTNNIDAYITNDQTLVQNNDADVYNKVDADAKSGDNDANFNNGSGDVSITTGPATTKVAVDNLVNFNAADVDCGCLLSDWDAKVANNGAFADSNINLDLGSEAVDVQYNDANLNNDLKKLKADSGYNDANYNNSHSNHDDPSITTGPANSWTSVDNQSNVNTLGSASLPEFPGLPDVGVDFSFSWGFLWTLLGLH